jgi:hypothetical protein
MTCKVKECTNTPCYFHGYCEHHAYLDTFTRQLEVTNVGSTTTPVLQVTPLAIPQESSGGDNDYWVADITDPKRLAPYKAECEDIIEHFQMSFQEGEAFKALWRNGAMRLGKGKHGHIHHPKAEKVSHMGKRMEVIEKRKVNK